MSGEKRVKLEWQDQRWLHSVAHTWMYMSITEELAQMGVLMGWFSEWDKRACISKKFPNELIISVPGPH